MNKFKKWLIHKLGGFVYSDELPPSPVIKENIELVRIRSCIRLSAYERDLYGQSSEYKNYVERVLKEKLLEFINPDIILQESPQTLNITVKAYMDIPSEYIAKE